MLDRLFLNYSVDKLRQLEGRIKVCLDKLTFEQIWWRGSGEQNAIGNMVLHLSGNVRQWLLTGVGGDADARDRDAEFSASESLTGPELAARLQETMSRTYSILTSLPPGRLEERMSVQGFDVSVIEGIYHVVEHFSMHAGQILYVTKMLRQEDLGFYKFIGSGHRETTP